MLEHILNELLMYVGAYLQVPPKYLIAPGHQTEACLLICLADQRCQNFPADTATGSFNTWGMVWHYS